MAEKKFSELTAKGATIADTDIVAISESAGGGAYTSKSVTGANIKALVTDANMTTTDITTNDVSTSKHGFAPKAPNDTTKFLRGDATWAVVPAGGLTKFTEAEATTSPNNTVYVDSLTAAGSTTNVDVAIVPKGTGAILAAIPDGTATGGNKRGTNAIDLQTSRSAATQVASNSNSVAIGNYNTASGNGSMALGYGGVATAAGSTAIQESTTSGNYSFSHSPSNTASGQRSASIVGQSNTTSGDFSANLGGSSNVVSANYAVNLGGNSNTNTGYYSVTSGKNVNNNYGFGRHVRGYNHTANADCQKSEMFLSVRTTGNTATTLTAGGGGAIYDNQLIIFNNSAVRFKGTIIGKKSGTTDFAAWDVDGVLVRGANAASTTLSVSNVTLVQNTPAWGTPTLAAETTNGGLRVQVTGAASTNIQWTAVIETTEVIYA